MGGLLQRHQAGVREASTELVALVAAEIRRIAPQQQRERGTVAGPDEQLTHLLSRLLSDSALDPGDRAPFLTVYARAVRRVLCEYLAQHGAAGLASEPASGAAPAPEMILAIDGVLTSLERVNARLVSVVECLYFARLTEEETAAAVRGDVLSVQREWTRARAWLLKELTEQGHGARREDVSVTNAVWVDAVLRNAVALPVEERGEFLEQCHAAAPGLRKDVEDLLRLSAPEMPGPRPGDLSAASLWSCLAGAPPAPASEPLAPDPPVPDAVIEDPAPTAPATPRFGEWRVLRDLGGGHMGPLYLVERGGDHALAAARVLPVVTDPRVREQLAHECRALSALPGPQIARLIDSGETSDGQLHIAREYVEGRPIDRHCDDERLGVEDRVRLMLRVCAAVQRAHRRLVAHGALSPANVLVRPDGEVTLVDCGMASLLATVTGSAWRPTTGSPEQARGEAATVMSDVYQLGALLRELLARERTHHPPSGRRARAHDGDLDAIIELALRDDPDKRYSSVGALRSDLQRWLDDRPVWARRDTRRYRARKFVSRRRVPLALGGVAVLVGALVLPWYFGASTRSDPVDDRAAQVNQLLAGILVPADPMTRAEAPGARTYVDRAAAIVRRERLSHPGEQAMLLLTIGKAYAAIGHYQPAIELFEETLALRRAADGDDSTAVADVLERLGHARHMLGRYDEAESGLRLAAAIRATRLGSTHPGTVSANVALAAVLHERGDLQEAEEILRASVTALEGSPGNGVLTRALVRLARVLSDRGNVNEAGPLFRQALERHGAEPGGADADARAATHVGLAALLIAQAKLAEAEAQLTEALPVLRRHDPHHPLLLEPLWIQARLRIEQGRLDEARAALQQAERIQRQSVQAFPLAVPVTRALQAEIARREGRFDDAVDSSRLALEEFERLALPDHPMTIEIRATLADALIALGRRDEAVPVLGRAITAVERVAPAGDQRTVRLRTSLLEATASRH